MCVAAPSMLRYRIAGTGDYSCTLGRETQKPRLSISSNSTITVRERSQFHQSTSFGPRRREHDRPTKNTRRPRRLPPWPCAMVTQCAEFCDGSTQWVAVSAAIANYRMGNARPAPKPSPNDAFPARSSCSDSHRRARGIAVARTAYADGRSVGDVGRARSEHCALRLWLVLKLLKTVVFKLDVSDRVL